MHRRGRWELQAALRGRCAPVFPEGPAQAGERCLWVFAPDNPHGWTGDPGRPCSIAVFHFDRVPEPLAAFVRRTGWLRAPLAEREVARVAALAAEMQRDLEQPSLLSPLLHEQAAIELALLACRRLDPRELAPPEPRAAQIVERALAWYDEHMQEAPRLSEVAEAVGLSASHLRRLFHRATGTSPHALLAARRLERACYLLGHTAMSIEEIAVASGFDSASSFSRFFRKAKAVPPRAWRRLVRSPINAGPGTA